MTIKIAKLNIFINCIVGYHIETKAGQYTSSALDCSRLGDIKVDMYNPKYCMLVIATIGKDFKEVMLKEDAEKIIYDMRFEILNNLR